MEGERKAFDAAGHMRKIRTRQGMQDYLDVKWRVAWLRDEHPEAQVVTEQIEADAVHARFKCTIRIMGGITRGSDAPAFEAIATGHGSETQEDFPDFYEKAETKAIGRACAALGYGTDMAADFDDGEPMDGRGAAKDERRARHETPQDAPQGAKQGPQDKAPAPKQNAAPRPAGPAPAIAPVKPNTAQYAALIREATPRGLVIPKEATWSEIANIVARGKAGDPEAEWQGPTSAAVIYNALVELPLVGAV